MVTFNNHFRGFSPQDANEFKQAMGMSHKQFKKQPTLTDFISKKE